LVDGFWGQLGVESLEGRSQLGSENDFGLVLAIEFAGSSLPLVATVSGCVAELLAEGDGF